MFYTHPLEQVLWVHIIPVTSKGFHGDIHAKAGNDGLTSVGLGSGVLSS